MFPVCNIIMIFLLSLFRICGTGFVNAEDFSENVSDASLHYPLKTGAEWNFEGTGTSPSISFNIVATEKINDKLYSKIEQSLRVVGQEEQKNIQPIFARYEDNRVYWLIPPREEHLMFDFTTQLNQSWTDFQKINNDEKAVTIGRIVGTDITVKVPAGVFEGCLVYEITSSTIRTDDRSTMIYSTYWIAPEIGIIKITHNICSDNLPIDHWINELSNYYIPK